MSELDDDEFEPLATKRPRPVEVSWNRNLNDDPTDDTEHPSEADEETDDDGTEGCPICFEPWANSGFHRLVSLKCGHLFGKRCVERWLANGTRQKCPQCNAPAKKAEIRVLYAKKLIAVDLSERDGLARQLQEEKVLKRMALEAEAAAYVALKAAQAELTRTKAELAALKSKMTSFGDESIDHVSAPRFGYHRAYKLAHHPGACRCLDYDEYYSTFLVSKAAAGRGHGISKVSLLDESIAQMHGIHSDMIRCIKHSPFKDGLILSTGNDKTLSLTNIANSVMVQTYQLDSPGWSCAFDPANPNRVLVGLASGSIRSFDLRNTSQHLEDIRPELPRKLPIHSLYACESSILGATLDGPFIVRADGAVFMEQSSGSCTSLSRTDSPHFLASFRHSNKPAEHIIAEYTEDFYTTQHSYASESVQTIMSRSALLQQDERLVSFIPDEPSASLQLYSHSANSASGQTSFSRIATHAQTPIMDVACGANPGRGHVVGALTDTDLYVFTQQLESLQV